MLRIAICDDDKILVTQIEEMLNRYLDKKMIDRYIEIFYDGASLERIYEKGDRFDIIYLDIEMSGKNGIEAAKSIRRLDRDPVMSVAYFIEGLYMCFYFLFSLLLWVLYWMLTVWLLLYPLRWGYFI